MTYFIRTAFAGLAVLAATSMFAFTDSMASDDDNIRKGAIECAKGTENCPMKKRLKEMYELSEEMEETIEDMKKYCRKHDYEDCPKSEHKERLQHMHEHMGGMMKQLRGNKEN